MKRHPSDRCIRAAVTKNEKDPMKELLAGIQPALFLGNPTGTVAIMQARSSTLK